MPAQSLDVAWVLLVQNQRLPGWREVGPTDRNGDFLVQQSRFWRGAAAQAQRQYSNGATQSALRHGKGIADVDSVVGLSYRRSVDGDRPCCTETSGK